MSGKLLVDYRYNEKIKKLVEDLTVFKERMIERSKYIKALAKKLEEEHKAGHEELWMKLYEEFVTLGLFKNTAEAKETQLTIDHEVQSIRYAKEENLLFAQFLKSIGAAE